MNRNDHSFDLPNTIHLISFFEHINCLFANLFLNSQSNQLEQWKPKLSLDSIHLKYPNLQFELESKLIRKHEIPHLSMDQLDLYELPILSELLMNLILRILWIWEPVERIWFHRFVENEVPSDSDRSNSLSLLENTFQLALIGLMVLDRFMVTFSSYSIYVSLNLLRIIYCFFDKYKFLLDKQNFLFIKFCYNIAL